MSVASAGARPWSIARSSISGLRASMTARKSFFGLPLNARLAQYAEALVLLAGLRTPARDEQQEGDECEIAGHRHGDRQRGEAERHAVGVEVDQRCRPAREAAPRTREQGRDRQVAERGAACAGEDAPPARSAV